MNDFFCRQKHLVEPSSERDAYQGGGAIDECASGCALQSYLQAALLSDQTRVCV